MVTSLLSETESVPEDKEIEKPRKVALSSSNSMELIDFGEKMSEMEEIISDYLVLFSF